MAVFDLASPVKLVRPRAQCIKRATLAMFMSRPRCRCCAIKQVRRQSEATTAPFVATGDVQSGVALRLPPHSKNSANGPYHAGPLCYRAFHSRGTVATSQIIPLICASLTDALGLLTFFGWVSGLPLLASVRAKYIPMAPSHRPLLFPHCGRHRKHCQDHRLRKSFDDDVCVVGMEVQHTDSGGQAEARGASFCHPERRISNLPVASASKKPAERNAI